MVCCFFGHRDTPQEYSPILEATVERLITEEGACEFYVGTHGNFDGMALKVLRLMKQRHPHICYSVVLAYHPGKQQTYEKYLPEETVYPDGLEKTPLRFAIIKRNCWMLQKSDCTIVCIVPGVRSSSSAMAKKAARMHKRIINIHK